MNVVSTWYRRLDCNLLVKVRGVSRTCCTYLRDVPGHGAEDDHGDGHDNGDNPAERVSKLNRLFVMVLLAKLLEMALDDMRSPSSRAIDDKLRIHGVGHPQAMLNLVAALSRRTRGSSCRHREQPHTRGATAPRWAEEQRSWKPAGQRWPWQRPGQGRRS